MPVMTFMVDHAVTIISRFSVDHGVRIITEKARGRTVNRDMAEFGETTLIQPVTECNKTTKLDARWHYGVFMEG